jgi:hypothetical protein
MRWAGMDVHGTLIMGCRILTPIVITLHGTRPSDVIMHVSDIKPCSGNAGRISQGRAL